MSGGSLLVNNTLGSGSGSGVVIVNSARTKLGGTGTIDGRAIVNGTANLAPGNGGHTTAIFGVDS